MGKGCVCVDRVITQEEALRSAFASSRMEGFEITPDVEKDCRRLLNGEVSASELARQIKAQYAKRTDQ